MLRRPTQRWHPVAVLVFLASSFASILVCVGVARVAGDLRVAVLAWLVGLFGSYRLAVHVHSKYASRAWDGLLRASEDDDVAALRDSVHACRELFGTPKEPTPAVFLDLQEARVLIAYDDLSTARELLRTAAPDLPSEYRAVHAGLLAYAYFLAGDAAQAAELAERALAIGAGEHEGFVGDLLAMARLALGDPDAAIDRWTERRDASNVTHEAWFHFGEALRARGRGDEAALAYTRALRGPAPWSTRAREALDALGPAYR